MKGLDMEIFLSFVLLALMLYVPVVFALATWHAYVWWLSQPRGFSYEQPDPDAEAEVKAIPVHNFPYFWGESLHSEAVLLTDEDDELSPGQRMLGEGEFYIDEALRGESNPLLHDEDDDWRRFVDEENNA